MNATPSNLNPVNAVQPSASGKQQDATPNVPFSQVLSSEIAQNRHGGAAKGDSEVKTGTDATSQLNDTTGTGAVFTIKATEAEEPTRGLLDSPPSASAPAMPDAFLALAIPPDLLKSASASMDGAQAEQPATLDTNTPAPAMPDAFLALAIPPDLLKPASASMGGAQAEQPATLDTNPPAMPDALLAPAIHPDLLKPASASMDGAQAEQPGILNTNTLEARKGAVPLAPLTPQASQTVAEATNAADATNTLNIDSARPGKADLFQAAMATALSGQPVAAPQSDTVKTGEFVPDLMSNPAIRPAAYAAVDTPLGIDKLAANTLAPSVGTTAWGQALGEKIVWMAAGAQQTATLTLNPPNLGPLQIVLNVTNDQATASFFSVQPEVRQALESAFPRLREMMNEAGIQLGQATVSADTPRQNDTSDRQAQRTTPPFVGTDEAVPAGLQPLHAPVQQSGRGLIDTFA